jgi:hypothetical protein
VLIATSACSGDSGSPEFQRAWVLGAGFTGVGMLLVVLPTAIQFDRLKNEKVPLGVQLAALGVLLACLVAASLAISFTAGPG